MIITTALLVDLVTALERAKRTLGWNMRSDTIQRFVVCRRFGDEPCTVIVVPCRMWVYRRWKKQMVNLPTKGASFSKASGNAIETVSETFHGIPR